MIRKHLDAAIVKADEARRHITFVASQEMVDRDNEVILVAGIDTTEFARNPVFLIDHDRGFVGGRVTTLRVEPRPGGRALIGEADILPAGTSERVDEAWGAISFGARSGISIGFLPEESDRQSVMAGQRGLTYRRVKLLEISSVSLPSCPTCVIESKAFKGCGCNGQVLVLDDESFVGKSGRVISSANEAHLRRADTAIAEAQTRVRAVLGSQTPDDENVLNIEPAAAVEEIEASPRAVAAAIAAAIRDSIREVIQVETTRAIHRARGRVLDIDPAADPAARRHGWGGPDVSVDRAVVDRILRGVIAEAIGDPRALAVSVGAVVSDTLRILSGKVD